MAAPFDITQFQEALVVLGSAALVIPVFHSLKVSPVLGYILIGMVVGPSGLGALSGVMPWLSFFSIQKSGAISHAAEFGVVLLMFMIGLELSLERLVVMRRLVFGLGTVQVVLSAGLIGGVSYLLTGDVELSVVAGLALCMSSTAIVIQVLSERKQLNSGFGRASFATLVFQDIAVIPVLFVIGVLGPSQGGAIAPKLGAALLQAAVAVGVVVIFGRILLRPIFRRVASTKSPELFMSACLLVILVISVTTAQAGLSMALGALLAGLLLAETEYRRQIEFTIEPFKGLLVGVFLISAGMNVDLPRILLEPVTILIASVSLIAVKVLVVAGTGPLFGLSMVQSIRAGLMLGPGSEFSFVIVSLAAASQAVSGEDAAFILIVAALTMASIPALFNVGKFVERFKAPAPRKIALSLPQPKTDGNTRVIIAGFGRVGRLVAEMLDRHQISYLAVDMNADSVARARDEGFNVYFGDVRQADFLKLCGVEQAAVLVLTMDSPKAANAAVQAARSLRGDVPVVARARDAKHASELYRLGVSDAVPETVESSLQLAEVVLVDAGIAMGHAIASIHEKRSEIRTEIQSAAPEGAVRAQPRRRLRDALGPGTSEKPRN